MVLQNFVWQNEEMAGTEELYYHSSAGLQISADGMKLPAGTDVSFDTYFNVFLAKNWKRYTKVKSVEFCFEVCGEGRIQLLGENEKLFCEKKFSGEQEVVLVAHTGESSYFYVKLSAMEDCLIKSGSVEASEPEEETDKSLKAVKLALVTCTYNRQSDLKKNVALLKKNNHAAPDGSAVLEQIYVIDNASNLNREEIEGERVTLVPNRNTGGAGGFTRGLLEAMKNTELTHILLMDDDVHVEFEALRRTKAFLSCLREEYAEHFLGGAMLRTDVPYVLHASGEDWADGHIKNPYKSTDIRDIQNVLRVSEPVETKQAYAGWWYCCIPRSHVEQHGYPVPFFLHCDDVEYSLRSGKPPIYLNGVAVWHEEFEDKRSSVMEYYDTRNRLITNARYKEHGRKRDALYILCERFYATVFRYRYRDFELSVKAVEDFLKGPEWLYSVDSEALHKSLAEYGYKMAELKEVPENEDYRVRSKATTIGRYFLPAFGSTVIRMGAPVSAYAGKKKVLLVEPKSGKGFEVRKSWRETGRCVGRLMVGMNNLIVYYRNTENVWRNGDRKHWESQ